MRIIIANLETKEVKVFDPNELMIGLNVNDDDVKVINGLKENKYDTYYAFPNTTSKELQDELIKKMAEALKQR